jgi:LmbE family N-acetylglucosaminyl deacetylase
VVRALGHRTWLELRDRARSLDEGTLASLSPLLVRVAYLTDGAASHSGSPSWSAARLTRTRRLEALRALSLLGVPRRRVCFLGWRDAQPFKAQGRRYRQSLAQLVQWAARCGLRSVWAPWRGERHCDHVAAAGLADDLACSLVRPPVRMDYLVWGWFERRLAREAPRAWKLDCPGSMDVRRRALACHRTQIEGLIADAATSFQIPPALAALTQRPVEIYLKQP